MFQGLRKALRYERLFDFFNGVAAGFVLPDNGADEHVEDGHL